MTTSTHLPATTSPPVGVRTSPCAALDDGDVVSPKESWAALDDGDVVIPKDLDAGHFPGVRMSPCAALDDGDVVSPKGLDDRRFPGMRMSPWTALDDGDVVSPKESCAALDDGGVTPEAPQRRSRCRITPR